MDVPNPPSHPARPPGLPDGAEPVIDRRLQIAEFDLYKDSSRFYAVHLDDPGLVVTGGDWEQVSAECADKRTLRVLKQMFQ